MIGTLFWFFFSCLKIFLFYPYIINLAIYGIIGLKSFMDDYQKHYAELKEPGTKDYILYNSIYMKF